VSFCFFFFASESMISGQAPVCSPSTPKSSTLTPLPSGRTHIVPATDLSRPDVRSVFETNVFGAMAMCQLFMDLLVPAKGLIINIASLAAVTPYVFSSVYCASKAALVAYSRTLRAEVRPLGVRVMVAMAGQVRSELSTRLGHLELPEGSLYKPVEQAYRDRLAFSVSPESMAKKMPAEVFAKRLVEKALKPEVPAWLRTWFGRPDWFWEGRNVSKVWWGLSFGEWIVEAAVYRMFGMPRIERVFRELEAKKLK
jgi:1-acylglycerone phosphate reductase